MLYNVLVEQSKDGLFVPEDRHDILVEAIGIEDYHGRVRGLGSGSGFKTFLWTIRSTRVVHNKE